MTEGGKSAPQISDEERYMALALLVDIIILMMSI